MLDATHTQIATIFDLKLEDVIFTRYSLLKEHVLNSQQILFVNQFFLFKAHQISSALAQLSRNPLDESRGFLLSWAKNVQSIKFDGNEIVYRSLNEMLKARSILQNEINKKSNRRVAVFSRGL